MFHFPKKTFDHAVKALLLGSLVAFSSCQDHRTSPAPADRPDVLFYGLSDNNQLLRLNVRTPETAEATLSITGMAAGAKLLGIDFRPATGQLYGIGSDSQLYVIHPQSGAARPIGSPFTPALNGAIAGFDFNPTVDRIRLVTNTGHNLRLNPETGAVAATDSSINGPAAVALSAAAYTNNRAGVTTTTLYDIDPLTDKLYKQDPPNDGKLVEVGALGLPISDAAGFDIAPDGRGLVSVVFEGKAELQTIDLTTGRLQKLGDLPTTLIGLAVPTEPVAYAVDNSNNLHIFNPTNPALVQKSISGLQAGETVLGIDFRPRNGQLYALGSSSRIYTLNTSTGAATAVGSGPFSPALSGDNFGFDFNPTVDRIRVVSSSRQNLRLHPETGAVAFIDGNLNPGAPAVSAAAYTNNFAGATATILYDIDTNTDKLYQQDPPNAGMLMEVGSLGVDVSGANGFDIGGTSGLAYGILTVGNATKLYRIDLGTGTATAVADFPATVRGFALGLGF